MRPDEVSIPAEVVPAGISAEAISVIGAEVSPRSSGFLLGALGAAIFKFEIIGRLGAGASGCFAAAADLSWRRVVRESVIASVAEALATSAAGIGDTAAADWAGAAAIGWACSWVSVCAGAGTAVSLAAWTGAGLAALLAGADCGVAG